MFVICRKLRNVSQTRYMRTAKGNALPIYTLGAHATTHDTQITIHNNNAQHETRQYLTPNSNSTSTRQQHSVRHHNTVTPNTTTQHVHSTATFSNNYILFARKLNFLKLHNPVTSFTVGVFSIKVKSRSISDKKGMHGCSFDKISSKSWRYC